MIDPHLAAEGLNIQLVADGTAYQDILPGCRSVVVYASGGRRLWEGFVERCKVDPAWVHERPHALDLHVRSLVGGRPGRWVFCSPTESTFVDFRLLAHAAGVGHASRLGLLIHPRWGTWMGLRAACFTTEHLAPTGPLPGDGPCATCHAPCVSSCPVSAVTERVDIGTCARFVHEEDTCKGGCLSRRACPVGEEPYDPLEQAWHTDHARGRRQLAAHLGVDLGEGPPSGWGAWAKKG